MDPTLKMRTCIFIIMCVICKELESLCNVCIVNSKDGTDQLTFFELHFLHLSYIHTILSQRLDAGQF
jgi:hypothetical protein